MRVKELKIPGIREGTVIDHIPSDKTFKAIDILNLTNSKNVISVATNLQSKSIGFKGIIKIGGKFLSKEEVNKIALIAPQATVNIIKNYEVKQKIKLAIPGEINSIIKCPNPKCITNNEDVKTRFYTVRDNGTKFMCHYCERCISLGGLEIL